MINTSTTVSQTKYSDVTIYTDDAMYLVPKSGPVLNISGITLPNKNDPKNKNLNIDVKSSSWQIKVGALVGGNHAPPGVYTLDIIVDERYQSTATQTVRVTVLKSPELDYPIINALVGVPQSIPAAQYTLSPNHSLSNIRTEAINNAGVVTDIGPVVLNAATGQLNLQNPKVPGSFRLNIYADVTDSTSKTKRVNQQICKNITVFITNPVVISLKYDDNEWAFVNQPLTITPHVLNQPANTSLRFKAGVPVVVSGAGPLVPTLNTGNGDFTFQSANPGDYQILITCEAVNNTGAVVQSATYNVSVSVYPQTNIQYDPVSLQVGQVLKFNPAATSILSKGYIHEFVPLREEDHLVLPTVANPHAYLWFSDSILTVNNTTGSFYIIGTHQTPGPMSVNMSCRLKDKGNASNITTHVSPMQLTVTPLAYTPIVGFQGDTLVVNTVSPFDKYVVLKPATLTCPPSIIFKSHDASGNITFKIDKHTPVNVYNFTIGYELVIQKVVSAGGALQNVSVATGSIPISINVLQMQPVDVWYGVNNVIVHANPGNKQVSNPNVPTTRNPADYTDFKITNRQSLDPAKPPAVDITILSTANGILDASLTNEPPQLVRVEYKYKGTQMFVDVTVIAKTFVKPGSAKSILTLETAQVIQALIMRYDQHAKFDNKTTNVFQPLHDPADDGYHLWVDGMMYRYKGLDVCKLDDSTPGAYFKDGTVASSKGNVLASVLLYKYQCDQAMAVGNAQPLIAGENINGSIKGMFDIVSQVRGVPSNPPNPPIIAANKATGKGLLKCNYLDVYKDALVDYIETEPNPTADKYIELVMDMVYSKVNKRDIVPGGIGSAIETTITTKLKKVFDAIYPNVSHVITDEYPLLSMALSEILTLAILQLPIAQLLERKYFNRNREEHHRAQIRRFWVSNWVSIDQYKYDQPSVNYNLWDHGVRIAPIALPSGPGLVQRNLNTLILECEHIVIQSNGTKTHTYSEVPADPILTSWQIIGGYTDIFKYYNTNVTSYYEAMLPILRYAFANLESRAPEIPIKSAADMKHICNQILTGAANILLPAHARPVPNGGDTALDYELWWFMHDFTDEIQKYNIADQPTILNWMISKRPNIVSYKWPWFPMSKDTEEVWNTKTALKWIFSTRHKINGVGRIKDYKFFACCILRDAVICNNIIEYLNNIKNNGTTYNNLLAQNVNGQFHYFKAQIQMRGLQGADHCERHPNCRIGSAPDRVAFELFWINQAIPGCWTTGQPAIDPSLNTFITMFNIDKIKMQRQIATKGPSVLPLLTYIAAQWPIQNKKIPLTGFAPVLHGSDDNSDILLRLITDVEVLVQESETVPNMTNIYEFMIAVLTTTNHTPPTKEAIFKKFTDQYVNNRGWIEQVPRLFEMKPASAIVEYMISEFSNHVESKKQLTKEDLKFTRLFLRHFVLGAFQSKFSVAMLEYLSDYCNVEDEPTLSRIKTAIRNRLVIPPPRDDKLSVQPFKTNTQYNLDLYYEAYTYYKATLLYYLRLQGVQINNLIDAFKTKPLGDLADEDYIEDTCFVSKDMRPLNMSVFSRIYAVPGININISPPALVSVFNTSDRQQQLQDPGVHMPLVVKDSPYRHNLLYIIDMKNYIKLDWLVAMLHTGLSSFGCIINKDFPTSPYKNHAYIVGFIQMTMAIQWMRQVPVPEYQSIAVQNAMKVLEIDVLNDSLTRLYKRRPDNKPINMLMSTDSIIQDYYNPDIVFDATKDIRPPIITPDITTNLHSIAGQVNSGSFKITDFVTHVDKSTYNRMTEAFVAYQLYKDIMSVLAVMVALFMKTSATVTKQLTDFLALDTTAGDQNGAEELRKIGLHLPKLVYDIQALGIKVDAPDTDPDSVESKKVLLKAIIDDYQADTGDDYQGIWDSFAAEPEP